MSSGRASAAESTATLSARAPNSFLGISHLPHAAADGERDREPLGHAAHQLDERPMAVESRADVEKY